jgi:hypothetical protein
MKILTQFLTSDFKNFILVDRGLVLDTGAFKHHVALGVDCLEVMRKKSSNSSLFDVLWTL